MRRTVLLLASVLLAVVALGSDSPKEYDDKTAVASIDGTWRLVEMKASDQEWKDTYLVLTLRNGTFALDEGHGAPSRGTYRSDPTHKPGHLDRFCDTGPRKGQTSKWIYHIDHDTLRIAYKPNGSQRPQGFSGDGVYAYTYKRVK